MKTKFIAIAVAVIFSFSLITSCNSSKDKEFPAFTVSSAEVNFTIAKMKSPTISWFGDFLGAVTTNLNIDSIIDAQIGGSFSLDDIKSVNFEEIRLTILNADTANNFANLDIAEFYFLPDTNQARIGIANGPNPDVYSESLLIPVDKSFNLKKYLLQKTQLKYQFWGYLRRATTKPLNCKLSIRYKIK